MKVNEKILERVNNIQEQLKNVQNLNMNDIVDLKRAQESVRVIKDDFNKMLKESPLYAKIMDLVQKFLDYDITADIEHWENLISNKIKELKEKADDHEAPECAGCTCNCEECVPDNVEDEMIDFEDDGVFIEDNPLTGEELLEDYISEELIEESTSKETFADLVADYINENHEYLDRVDDDDEIEYLANVLFDFINFTMKR